MLILTASDVGAALDMPATIRKVGQALAQLSAGQARVPERLHVGVPEEDGTVLYMPATAPLSNAMGTKVVSVYPRNSELSLPTIFGAYLLLNMKTGAPLALMDGGALTALRTGAVVGLASDLLARPGANCLAVIGTGTQARAAVKAVMHVRPLLRINLYNRSPEKAYEFAKYVEGIAADIGASIEVQLSPDPDHAVKGADIVLTATTSSVPVFGPDSVGKGVHINAIGAFTPRMQEIPTSLVSRAAKVVVESRVSALAEAGDLLIPIAQGLFEASRIHAELGEIYAGHRPGRQDDTELTVFKSVGHAIMDVVVAKAIYDHAFQAQKGTEVDLLA